MRVCPLSNMLEIGFQQPRGGRGVFRKVRLALIIPLQSAKYVKLNRYATICLANSLLVHVLGKGVAVLFFPSAIKLFNFCRTALLSSPTTIRPPGDTTDTPSSSWFARFVDMAQCLS